MTHKHDIFGKFQILKNVTLQANISNFYRGGGNFLLTQSLVEYDP